MGWDGMGWDGMGWDGMGWDGMGWDGMGWGDLRKLSGDWSWDMVAVSHPALEQEKAHSLSRTWWGLPQVQEPMLLLPLVSCLDVAEQETFLSGTFLL